MATTPESGPRRSAFWIDDFLELTSEGQSPELFRKWAAVVCIAGALERKVWAKAFRGRETFPNVYALLVGPPGIGKTDALRETIRFWEKLPDLHVAPSSVSRASLIDALNEAARTVVRPQHEGIVQFNSLQIAATEFGTFLTAYEGEFLSTLNDLWDCVRYKERKRGNKLTIEMDRPQLSLIAGTTPAWLGSTLPEQAWAEGFSSRLLVVYSGHRIKVTPFQGDPEFDETLDNDLTHDLLQIHSLFGQFTFDPDMAEAFIAGHEADFPPVPTHPKLEHYLPRRPVHLLKLTMIMSAARSSDLVMRLIDYQRALDLLLETESYIPDVFKSMRTSTDANTIDEVYNFVYTCYAKEGKGIGEQRVLYFLSQKVPGHSVNKILEVMLGSGILLIDDIAGGKGGRPSYKPAQKGTF
jgi:hypothetical protein